MRTSIRDAVIIAAISAGGSVALGARTPQTAHQHPAEGGAHHHPQAAQLKNAVPVSPASIAAGQALYQKQCAGCHGDTGKGDGTMGAELDPKPSNLTDADWKHGSTDGEIFTVIRGGVKSTGMKPFSRKLTTHQLWDVVNYVRSLGPKTGSH
jgi:mono/diheme cytochrome c family protein